MYPGPTDPDLGVFVRGLDEQLVARRHEVSRRSSTARREQGEILRTRARRAPLRAASGPISVPREPAERWWGGYSGVFLDLDGHPWEVAYNPGMPLGSDGSQIVRD